MQLTGTNVLKTFVNTKETISEDCGCSVVVTLPERGPDKNAGPAVENVAL